MNVRVPLLALALALMGASMSASAALSSQCDRNAARICRSQASKCYDVCHALPGRAASVHCVPARLPSSIRRVQDGSRVSLG